MCQKLEKGAVTAMGDPISALDLKNVHEDCYRLCVGYVLIFFILQNLTRFHTSHWKINRTPRRNGTEDYNLTPSCSHFVNFGEGVETREVVSIRHGSRGCIFLIVMGLAVYLHPMCPFFVVVPVVLLAFIGFRDNDKTCYDKVMALFDMDVMFTSGVHCFTEYVKTLVPSSVLQMATCCILTALYAMPLLFEAPQRVIRSPGPWMDPMRPNPSWVAVNASSMIETWQTVMHEYRETEQGLFFQFSTADYVERIFFVKCVIDVMLLIELYLLDVASQSTAQAFKLKAIIPFFIVRHRLNLFPMLQLSQATLSVNVFMAFTNMSFAMLVNPVITVFLSACKRIPFVGFDLICFYYWKQ